MKLLSIFIVAALVMKTSLLLGSNVGLLIMATGKYISFVEPLIDSAEQYFCKDHKVTYFVFTDGELKERENLVKVHQSRLGWPFDTMMRFQSYYEAKELFVDQDYLFACDADMCFVGEVGDEVLGERVATQHPGFVGKRGSYECDPASLACVNPSEGSEYFAGGFYGGSREEMLNITKVNSEHINEDLKRGIIAVWHDESHWNRYCIDHKPTVILSPSYCYPESWLLPYIPKLLALDKNHEEMRQK